MAKFPYQTFLAFGAFIATRETEKAEIDDLPFRLQYKVTTAIAFLSCALISASEMVHGKDEGKYIINKKRSIDLYTSNVIFYVSNLT